MTDRSNTTHKTQAGPETPRAKTPHAEMPLTEIKALRFIQIVESYGGNPSRWPEGMRDPALNFSAKHPTARIIHEQAKALDMALDTVMAPPASDTLRARILNAAAQTSTGKIVKAANDRLPYRAIAATLLVGSFLGFLGGGLPQFNAPNAYAATLETNIEVNSMDEHISYAWIGDSLTASGDLEPSY